MREIKFRAWDKRNKKWVEAGQSLLGYLIAWISDYKFEILGRGDYEIVQYTGLKDINGVEIYEGYIVLYKFASYKDISKVVYDEDSASFKMISIKEDDNTSWREFKKGSIHDFYKPFVNGYDFVKVIGNIYENPELLEG